jgi:H+-translocating NAD(P) transhydrogenase subunit alpha
MNDLLLAAGVFFASFAIGYLLITKVPPMLHTPLMSMTNAISAITILGALLLFSFTMNVSQKTVAAVAVVMAIFNVVGGFAITDRMLGMFREKSQKG